MAIGELVLSVVKIPDVHPSVLKSRQYFSSEEEDTRSGGREAAIGQVGTVISGPNDRRL